MAKAQKPYWVPASFLRLTDEQVGQMQYLMVDEGMRVVDCARRYGVSAGTAYRVRAAVPAHLVTIGKPAPKLAKSATRKARKRRAV